MIDDDMIGQVGGSGQGAQPNEKRGNGLERGNNQREKRDGEKDAKGGGRWSICTLHVTGYALSQLSQHTSIYHGL